MVAEVSDVVVDLYSLRPASISTTMSWVSAR